MKACDLCDKKFANNAGLDHHKMNTHKRKFTCDLCSFEAINLKSLNLHSANKHTNIPLIKGMGMKRDASIKSQLPTKRAKLFVSPNNRNASLINKEEIKEVNVTNSSDEDMEFEEPKPWKIEPWMNSDNEVTGLNIKEESNYSKIIQPEL